LYGRQRCPDFVRMIPGLRFLGMGAGIGHAAPGSNIECVAWPLSGQVKGHAYRQYAAKELLKTRRRTLPQHHVSRTGVREQEWRSDRIGEEEIWGNAVHRVAADGISPEQAIDEAIARIKEILSE
jgi:hypothetical protein